MRFDDPGQSLTAADIDARLDAIERAKKRILCHPDDFERIDRAIRDGGYDVAFRVIATSLLTNPGKILVLRSEAEEEADMQQAVARGMQEMLDEARRRMAAESEAEMERMRRRAWAYDVTPFRIVFPPAA